MKNLLRFNFFITLLLTILPGFAGMDLLNAQDRAPGKTCDPIYGKLMLVGEGEMSARVRATFALLAEEENGSLVIISRKDNSKILKTWQQDIGNVSMLVLKQSRESLSASDIASLHQATAVWLMDDFSEDLAGTGLNDELSALLLRDGVIGGQGAAAGSMAAIVLDAKNKRAGFNFLPNSIIHAETSGSDYFVRTLNSMPGYVGWEIPSQAAVVIHSGREISVVGDLEITLRTAANGDWPGRVDKYGPPVDDLPYTADLISWNRSASDRMGELFPPEEAPVPEVPDGALLIIGGHGYPEGMWQRAVDFAGGKEANYVCLSQSERCWGAEKLRELGCKNISVHMVHTGTEGIGQGSDPALLRDLENADFIYFGGGRTFRYLDAYMNTPAQELMFQLLKRGGLIVGTSAGAQIQGDFLVRGDPRTNNTIWMEGSDRGLGFLKGVIIDAHFRERGRHHTLPSLLVKHPQMLGIGIDETTAIWVQGMTAEVLGPHAVTFYDLKNIHGQDASSENVGKPVILREGQKYELRQRKALND